MAKNKYISREQLRHLQTLWSQHAAVRFDAGTIEVAVSEREIRLLWAEREIGRRVESFKQLTSQEASGLIDTLRNTLGLVVVAADRTKRRRMNRDDAHAAGTAGRKNDKSKSVQLVSADDLAAIEDLLRNLGWNFGRLDAWLKSPSSPLGRKAHPEVRTLADANKVRWALKALLRRSAVSGQPSAVSEKLETGNSKLETAP